MELTGVLELQLVGSPMWVLGTKHRSFRRSTSAFHYWAIFLATEYFTFKILIKYDYIISPLFNHQISFTGFFVVFVYLAIYLLQKIYKCNLLSLFSAACLCVCVFFFFKGRKYSYFVIIVKNVNYVTIQVFSKLSKI